MIIREATSDDNEGLLALTRCCPMDGSLKLLIDRKPNFFSLLQEKGPYRILVAESAAGIIGSFALVIKEVYIDQKPDKAGYLCDMKISPPHRNALVAHRLMRAMHAYMTTLPLAFYLCVIANGNKQVERLMEGRAGIPAAIRACQFKVFQLLPLKKETYTHHQIEPYHAELRSSVVALLNQCYRNYQFASVFPVAGFEGDIAWAATKNSQLSAFISLADTAHLKQHIVDRIPAHLKIFLRFMRWWWPHLQSPVENEPLKILYIKFIACAPGETPLALSLLQKARHYAFERGYTFLSYGMDSRNPLAKIFAAIPGVTFRSEGYVFDFTREKRWTRGSLCHDNFYQV